MRKKNKLAVIVPSRGLIFSKTFEELLNALSKIDHQIFFSTNNPIPDCFNLPIKEAMEDKSFTHILICEEDMIIPKDIVRQMLDIRYPAVALDYPFKGDDATCLRDPKGLALFTGTGFLLVGRIIFEKLPYPYFVENIAWDSMISREGELIYWPRKLVSEKRYGLHDVNFGITLYSNQVPIYVMPETTGQRKLVKTGRANSNLGTHIIREIKDVWINNITKNENKEKAQKFVDRINTIKTIRISNEIPSNIVYVDGQARLQYGKDEVI